jgi:hypothetical protein
VSLGVTRVASHWGQLSAKTSGFGLNRTLRTNPIM